jgi:hypothetical protein
MSVYSRANFRQMLYYNTLTQFKAVSDHTTRVLESSLETLMCGQKKLIIKSVSWGLSSVGRAPDWQSGGHRFDPVRLHRFSVI